jgi:hypothetical protein
MFVGATDIPSSQNTLNNRFRYDKPSTNSYTIHVQFLWYKIVTLNNYFWNINDNVNFMSHM